MANPFLFEDPVDYSDQTGVSSNPFLCGGDEPVNDNPFLASVSTAPGTNPFADYSWDEPPSNEGLLTPPHISNINDPENDFITSSDDESSRPKQPMLPRPSMPKETQDLILSVTGALKATSDHLLDRLPPTRAPSPTIFADLHSPSPTPDLLGGEDDFLSLSQQQERPAPPRPPVRPVPPAVPPAPVTIEPPLNDIIDFFGTPTAPQPKSKDAILNLYAQPKAPPQDLFNNDNDLPLQTPLFTDAGQAPEPVVQTGSDFVKTTPPDAPIHPKIEVKPPTRPPPPTTLPAQPAAVPVPVPKVTESPKQVEITPQQHIPDEDEPGPGIFGSIPPVGEEVPSIFGSIPPVEEEQPSIFGSIPPVEEEQPSIFGSIPAVEEEQPSIFGSIPPVEEEQPSIFGVGPPVAEEQSSIFGVGPPIEDLTSQVIEEPPPRIFGAGPPPRPQPPPPPVIARPVFAAEPPPVEPRPQPPPPPIQQKTQMTESTPRIFGTGPPPVEPRPQPPLPPTELKTEPTSQIFGVGPPSLDTTPTIFGVGPPVIDSFAQPAQPVESFAPSTIDAFDAFSAKFDEISTGHGDAFDPFGGQVAAPAADAWGTSGVGGNIEQPGFGGDDGFDAFLSMSQPPPVPQPTPNKFNRTESGDSVEGGFSIFIKPREGEVYSTPGIDVPAPALAPPPKSPAVGDNDPRFNPFDKNGQIPAFPLQDGFQLPALSQNEPYEGGFKRTDSQETPTTPLFDEDVSQPLEEFPRIHYNGDGWEMQLRQPNKKKITGQRFWKKIFVKLVYQGDNPVLQLFNLKEDKDPFQELPLQACYSVSEISAQQYDQFGKIFTVKLQYIFYKERPGVRPGQVTKAERITTKLSQFAAYAIQGDYQGVKEFGSDLKKLGLPVEHAPQISQLLKIGCMSFEDLKQFSVTIEECLFRMPVHRDRALTYKMEEVQITVVDEMYVEQDAYGHVDKQIARVRLFFLAFLSGMPDVELGMNDMWRQGKEVVGRHDIIPVVTEEWIRLESVEFHGCVQLDEYEKTRTIKFKPPDACYIELMRFRIRPPKNRELPLQLKAVMCVTGNKVELRADVLVPGFTSRKLGQIPCEDVMIRFPIPECWIYLFRVEKHFRYGSVKSAHRRTGKIKGIERFLGAVEQMEPHLMEVTSGQAKYEHQHRAIVWRMPRLPKEGQGAYTTHNLVCRMQLTSYDQIPDNLADYAYVEFTMPATTASHTTVRSVSLVDSDSDNPPEKYVRQLARLEYRVGIEHTQGEEMASYVAATATKPKPPPPTEAPAAAPPPPPPDSDSDSSG